MTRIKFDGQFFETEPSETVLQTLLRNNMQVPYGCRAGVCQSCLMRCLDDLPVPPASQVGLKAAQQVDNYFLPCICHPKNEMSVTKPVSLAVILLQRFQMRHTRSLFTFVFCLMGNLAVG